MKILAIDLGIYKSVACLYSSPTSVPAFARLDTGPLGFEQFV